MPASSRLHSIDALRGLIMILMALDHAREFFHAGAMTFQPEDLARTTPALFLTRWITHFCAPVFMLTAGIGAFLWQRRGRTKNELTRYLLTRGLWLIVLELTALRLAMFFSLTQGLVMLTILWALGWSMIALALLSRIPVRLLAGLSVAVIALHDLAGGVTARQFGAAAWIWNILHQPGVFFARGVPVLSAYPLIPWIFVMSAGFCFGHLFTLHDSARRRLMLRIGCWMTVAFFVLRGINAYGDPAPWSAQFPGMTALSFLRCTKYPPSLAFLLMTLGPAILVLGWLQGMRLRHKNPLLVFGRVPLFYFLAHLFLLHGLAIPMALLHYGRWRFLLDPMPSMGGDGRLYPPGFGYSLPAVHTVWAGVLVLMYPACLWFARLKERRHDWWLSYL